MTTPDHLFDEVLAITPIAAWRRWTVTGRRLWESGTGPVLRGMRGQPWEAALVKAVCLPMIDERLRPHNRRVRKHVRPSPDVRCRCGIYAYKPGVVDDVVAVRPFVVGVVQLFGTVVEACHGYRAEYVRIEGPLELCVPCVRRGADDRACEGPIDTVYRFGADIAATCALHKDDELGLPYPIATWCDETEAALSARYGVPVFDVTRSGEETTHGYR